jgi:hypothetical protein
MGLIAAQMKPCRNNELRLSAMLTQISAKKIHEKTTSFRALGSPRQASANASGA